MLPSGFGLISGKIAMTNTNYHFQLQGISAENSQFHKINGP